MKTEEDDDKDWKPTASTKRAAKNLAPKEIQRGRRHNISVFEKSFRDSTMGDPVLFTHGIIM